MLYKANTTGLRMKRKHISVNMVSLRDWEMKIGVWKGSGAVGKSHLPCGRESEVGHLSSSALGYSFSRSFGSKGESNFIGIFPSSIDWCNASTSSWVRCGGFSIALIRCWTVGFFPVEGSCSALISVLLNVDVSYGDFYLLIFAFSSANCCLRSEF